MRKFKGFTLLELIIVMAILSILMVSLMQMFKPIRDTYVDSTLYEAQRTSQNGMVRYITESVRYSTDMGVYNGGGVVKAVEDFAAVYLPANGCPTSSPTYSANVEQVKRYAEVIIIDNGQYTYNNKDWSGRILRRKYKNDGYGVPQPLTANAELVGSDECRLALGAAYYGESNYTIRLGNNPADAGAADTAIESGSASDGFKVTVTSLPIRLQKNRSYSDNSENNRTITNTGTVICRNQEAPISGVFDVSGYTATTATTPGSKVYIVFVNDKVPLV